MALLVGMYLLTLGSLTVGFHRLFTHRAFQTSKPVQFLLGVFGSMCFQGPLLDWVGRHRLHHRFSDRAGDPHSPYPHAPGVLGWLRGFWHSHIGWAFSPMQAGLERYAGDLRKSRMLRVVSAMFPVWALLGLLLPTAIGLLAGGWVGALTGFLWGGLVRVLLVHHVTWCINSVCHLWGTRPYPEKDQSRNNPVMGLLALGEGWHNNHHAFPTSARHGLKWWQVDLSWYAIRALAMVGLAWKVRVPGAGGCATGDVDAEAMMEAV
jgi:stearoyl-CoA desaturase (delta-9 desaturase)